MGLQTGDKAPEFNLPRDGGDQIALSDLTGGPVVLYFYPRDDTSGCTLEAQDFSDLREGFADLGARVLGVSKDSVKKHENFVTKYDLKVALLSDADGSTCEDYGVWVEKKMYGKTHMGIERATFLIGADGKIQRIWRKVKVPGHAAEVLQTLKASV